MINGILHRVRTEVQWRDLPERFGPWKTVYERHRPRSADGTWERLLHQIQAVADADAGANLVSRLVEVVREVRVKGGGGPLRMSRARPTQCQGAGAAW